MSAAVPPIDLRPDHLGIVRDILRRHVPDRKVLAFGSRATWTAKEYSDLDLAILGDKPLPLGVTAAMADDFSESDLPFKVDLVDWAGLDESFRDIIRRDQVAVQSPVRRSECNTSNPEWPIVTIEAISEKVAMGPFGSSIKVETFVPDGVPIISGQHLRSARVDDSPGFNFIAENHAQRLANANVQHGDIIFTHRGNIGQVAYIPEDSQFVRYIVSQSQFYMRCDLSKAIPEFVTAYFRSPEGQHKLLANASQVGVPSIARPVTYLRTIEIPLPPLPTQRAIAHILGTLDDKIELNRQMNKTLEAIARAIFKDWFVDFGPTRAKMEGRDPYLPPETWDLFPNTLDAEGKPTGWEKAALGTIFNVSIGRTPPRKESQHFLPGGKGKTWLSIKTMGNIQTFAVASDEDLTPNAIDQFRVPLIPAGTVLVSFKLTVGRVAIAAVDMHSNEAIAHLVENEKTPVSNLFTYCFMKGIDYDSLGSTSSIATAVNSKSIKGIEIIIPDKSVHGAFAATVKPVFDRILSNLRESIALTELRNTLLPKLISGEIRVRENEKAVEAVS